MERWWIIETRGKYVGKVYATEHDLREALGPYIAVSGNLMNVWGK